MKFLQTNYKLLLGILIGIFTSSLNLNILGSLFELLQIAGYICVLLYFLSFTLLEILIMRNLDSSKLKLLEIKNNNNMRCLSLTMSNENLLDGKDLFKAIYNTIMSNEEFKAFGYRKIIILTCTLEDFKEFNIHSNVLIDNDTPFVDYYNSILNDLTAYNNLEYGYHNLNIVTYTIKAWNCSNLNNLNIKITHNSISMSRNLDSYNKSLQTRSYSTSTAKHWSKGLITPLSLVNKNGRLKLLSPAPIFVMDIETIKYNNVQTPIAISSCGVNNSKQESKLFLIDHVLLNSNVDLAVKQLWNKYFNYLESLNIDQSINKLSIFAHNLGDFDGYFLYKGLMNHYNPEHLSSIIDESNSFISIKLLSGNKTGLIFEWKDSLRIFPMSLDKLCALFGVQGKLIAYNPKFNDISLFDKGRILGIFKKYALQDSISLYEALFTAQLTYFNKFGVDIESIYSTATLSLKIYRTKFLDKNIFILPQHTDLFIRQGYFGGGTDVYKAYAVAEKVYYYDVNSLYPAAMLNDMPYDLINPNLINLSNRTLDSFFGFAEVEVTCPTNMLRPVLPFHMNGKTIYPVGTWKGVYFSEELKAVVKLGYQITLIRGYEFTRTKDLFTNYVNTFYELKRTSVGSEKAIAKLLLNNLYGYFGRKQISILTQNVKNSNLEPILLSRVVKSIMNINKDYSTVLSYSNINYPLLSKLNNELHNNIENFHTPIKSNVAIAAAVTAYARIHMIPFKLDPNTMYTDTDSYFTTTPIDPLLLGDQLGLMKDEMKGVLIQEALFLGPKKYGYWYYDKDGNKVEKSVFAGVPRDSLSFNEIKYNLFMGETITKNVDNRFYKSFSDLNIDIKSSFITIKNSNDKILRNWEYLPIQVKGGQVDLFGSLYNKFKNLINKTIKKYFK
jgi:hypothetical protein